MISGLIDELRDYASRADGMHPLLASALRNAASTIWELRDKLQRANAENAKLRELVRRYGEYTSQDRCEGCVCKSRCNEGYIEECWQRTEIRELARELGVGEDG